MKSPAFQFYAADFLVGIMGMSDEEVGIYMRMLAYQWEHGSLPNCPKTIKKMVNSCKKPSEKVLKKFIISDENMLINERLENERKKQESYRKSRIDNANARWNKDAHASAMHKNPPCIDDALHSSSSSSSTPLKRSRATFSIPTVSEVAAYGMTLSPPLMSAQKFCDHHQSKGWVIGRSPMKDWKAAVRTWHSNEAKFSGIEKPKTSAAQYGI